MAEKAKEKLPTWNADVPPPEVHVCSEDKGYRAELTCYVYKGDRVKDIIVRGPMRNGRREALKDGQELRAAAFKGGYDPALFNVRSRRKEIESIKWKKEDMDDLKDTEEESRQRLREEADRRQKEKEAKEREEMNHKDALAQIAAREGARNQRFKPVGPKWQKPGSLVQLPQIADHPVAAWLIHEKQDASGKYRPWLFFNGATGKYYRQKDSGVGYIQTGVPHDPQDYPINVRAGSASLPSGAGKKLDLTVSLPELHKTGFLLKQPLEFMDRPASLMVLCDGLRNTSAASELCAKKLHTVLLPKLSARSTEWEDFELVDILRDSVEALDSLLLESPVCFAGCSLAVALQMGTRVALGALGGARCLVCRPPAVVSSAGMSARLQAMRDKIAASTPWSVQRISDSHTVASDDERLRVESVSNLVFADGHAGLSAQSVRPAVLAAISDERERLLLQVSRAVSPFAALGLGPEHLKEGAASIRKIFRKRSLVVHPDKVGEALRSRAVGVFAKLEASTTAVEAMLQADSPATLLLAEVDAARDAGRLGADPAAAAKLLGVQEGCTLSVAQKASKEKFHRPFSRLQNIASAHRDVERALKTLEMAEETVVRGTQLWVPAEADETVNVTRALGCKDLKVPVPMLTSGFVADCVSFELGTVTAMAMIADGAQSVSDAEVAKQLARHSPSRPRAAALRVAFDASKKEPGTAMGVMCAYFDFDSQSASTASSAAPPAKRAKTSKPDRVRVSHILLRFAGLRGEDEFARPGVTPATRTQVDAERELLELLEQLLPVDTKTLGNRFKAEILKRSECASALNVPYADLGWIDPGGAELALEAAAFATAVGGLSDVVTSTRGVHLMYRLA